MAVRRERVELSLVDHFSTGMVKAAAATALLDKNLDSLSGSAVRTQGVTRSTSRDIDGLTRSANRADGSINQLTGRLRLAADAAAIFGSTLIPLGGVGIVGLTGLASQLGFAAVAGGVLIGSFTGLSDALKAMNEAGVDPTKDNLADLSTEMGKLSKDSQEFVVQIHQIIPMLKALRQTGRDSMIPGFTESLEDMDEILPRVARIMQTVGTTLGDIASDSTASLASDRWADFFEFIATDAPQALSELATTVGSLTHGLAEMWMAFDPLNDAFSKWLMDAAAGFDEWATGLDQTEGFREFVEYIQTNGPQVADTMGAIGNALLQIVQASAPLGGPVLSALESVADVIGTIADSDLGTPILAGVAALSLLNRTLAITATLSKTTMTTGMFAGVGAARGGVSGLRADIAATQGSMIAAGGAAERLGGRLVNLGKGAAVVGGLALASSGAADGMGITNTASLALMGTIAGPWGAAIGGGIGLLLDIKDANDRAAEATASFEESLKSLTLAQLDAALAAEGRQRAEDIDSAPSAPSKWAAKQDTTNIDAIKAEIAAREEQIEAQGASALASRRASLAYMRQVGHQVSLAESARMSSDQLEAQAKALKESRDAARTTATQFVNLTDSVGDSEVSLSQWIQNMANTADALRNFRLNAAEAGKKGLREGLIRDLQEAGPEGALRMRQLANATDEEIARANRAWKRGQDEIGKYVKATADVPKSLATSLKVDGVPQAITNIDRIRNALAQVKDKTVTIRVTQAGTAAVSPGFGPVDRYVGGFTGPGDRLEPRGVVHAGEIVIPQDLAKRDWSMLSSRYGHLPGFADGGVVPFGGPGRPQMTNADLVALATTKAFQSLNVVLREFERRTELASESLDRETQKRDDLIAKAESLASATTSGFQTDLFSMTPGSSNPWAAGAKAPGGGWFDNLSTDIAGLTKRGELQSALALAGLDGDALAGALAQGSNEDLASLLASGNVQGFEDMFNQRAALTVSVGGQAGQAAFGAEIATLNSTVSVLSATVERMERAAQQVEKEKARRAEAREERREARADARADRQADRTGDRVNGAVAAPARNNPRPRVSKP